MVSEGRGVVLAGTGGRYRVLAEDREVMASLRGRLKLGRDHVVVGDTVTVAQHSDESWTIEHAHPRRTVLRRRQPGRTHGERIVAANVEDVVVVGAAARPPWDPHLMDRFIAVGEANGLPVILVINKRDLVDDPEPLAAPYRKAGYQVELTSVPDRRGLQQLAAVLEGRVSFLTGPTGVGKSSLLNALQPGLKLRTGEVGRRGGRHTTVAAELHRFGSHGLIADTPGLRDIGLWGLEPAEVARAFPELARFAAGCRFYNCRHAGEPSCAVVEAADRDDISWSRLISYRTLLEEARAAARPWE